MGFRDQAELRAVAIETPRSTFFDDVNPRLVMAVKELIGNLPAGGLVRQLQSGRAKPLNGDYGYKAVRKNTL
jgi:hypothetical protein